MGARVGPMVVVNHRPGRHRADGGARGGERGQAPFVAAPAGRAPTEGWSRQKVPVPLFGPATQRRTGGPGSRPVAAR